MKQRKVNKKGVYEYRPSEWETTKLRSDSWAWNGDKWCKVESVSHLTRVGGYEQIHRFKDKHDRVDYRLWQEDAPYATSLDIWYGFDV